MNSLRRALFRLTFSRYPNAANAINEMIHTHNPSFYIVPLHSMGVNRFVRMMGSVRRAVYINRFDVRTDRTASNGG